MSSSSGSSSSEYTSCGRRRLHAPELGRDCASRRPQVPPPWGLTATSAARSRLSADCSAPTRATDWSQRKMKPDQIRLRTLGLIGAGDVVELFHLPVLATSRAYRCAGSATWTNGVSNGSPGPGGLRPFFPASISVRRWMPCGSSPPGR